MLDKLRVLTHALDILSDDVVLAHHRLLLLLLRMTTLLAAHGALLASKTVVLLSTLRMGVDLDITVERVLLGGHSTHIVLRRVVHVMD